MRTAKDKKFKTIFEKPITCKEDFETLLFDYCEPTGIVEYAYVPIISGGESNYIINSVKSEFDSYFICERDKSYPLILDTQYSETVNYETATVKPLGRKYPIVITNGYTGYKSGEMQCTFIEQKECDWDVAKSQEYRNLIYDMLTDKTPKIFKDSSGNILLISINGNITEQDRQYVYKDNIGFDYVKSKFSWVECGDAYSVGDLYDANFIDTDVDR